MGNEEEGHPALKRFRRWKRRLPRDTSVLVGFVESLLVPRLMAVGYEVREGYFKDPENHTFANEIHLECHQGDLIDFVTLSFAKYGRPRFQVHFGKRRIAEPPERLLQGSLVSRSTQYYYWWGKPWWMPRVMWTDKRAEKVVKNVASRLNCVFQFLDTGVRDSNISQPIWGVDPSAR